MDEQEQVDDGGCVRRTCQRLRALVRLVAFGLLLTALVRELRTPRDERTWQGSIGVVPYDLRPPSLERLRDAWWNPDDDRVFTPRPMGVGWAVNLAALWARVRGGVAG